MTHDFFEMAKKRVEFILQSHNLQVDFEDDDTFNDFMLNIQQYNFTHGEKQILYTYNSMLQTIAFSMNIVTFNMVTE